MALPKMTPRRWFWSVMACGLAWSFAGWRWDGEQSGMLSHVQNGVSQIPETTLVPPAFILTGVQTFAQGVMNRFAAKNDGSESIEELRDKNRALENENAQLKGTVAAYYQQFQALQYLQKSRHIEASNVLSATVLGYGTGTAASLLRLDKGATSGVKPDDPVLAPLEQACLLGRVVSVGQLECLVRLTSDPKMKTLVQIVRPMLNRTPGSTDLYQNTPVTKNEEPCLLEGLGGGQMRIHDVNVQTTLPQVGDLVEVTDSQWPAKTQHMVIGQIDSVEKRVDNPLRYDLRVSSRVAITSQRTVMILINE